MSLQTPAADISPPLLHFISLWYKDMLLHRECTPNLSLSTPAYEHLPFRSPPERCPSWRWEVMLMRLRCRVPNLNVLTQKFGFVSSQLFAYCREPETIEHLLFTCKRFTDISHRTLPLVMTLLGIPTTTHNILAFAASSKRFLLVTVRDVLCSFVQN